MGSAGRPDGGMPTAPTEAPCSNDAVGVHVAPVTFDTNIRQIANDVLLEPHITTSFEEERRREEETKSEIESGCKCRYVKRSISVLICIGTCVFVGFTAAAEDDAAKAVKKSLGVLILLGVMSIITFVAVNPSRFISVDEAARDRLRALRDIDKGYEPADRTESFPWEALKSSMTRGVVHGVLKTASGLLPGFGTSL